MKTEQRTSGKISLLVQDIVKDVNEKFKMPKLPSLLIRVEPIIFLKDVALEEIKNDEIKLFKKYPEQYKGFDVDNPLISYTERQIEVKIDKKCNELWNKLSKNEKDLYREKAKQYVEDYNRERNKVLSDFLDRRIKYIATKCKKNNLKISTITNIVGLKELQKYDDNYEAE